MFSAGLVIGCLVCHLVVWLPWAIWFALWFWFVNVDVVVQVFAMGVF